MNQQEAIQLIRQTFTQPFDDGRFRRFVHELLNEIEETEFSHQGPYIPRVYEDHIRQFKRVGTYTDPDGKRIDVLIVRLQKESSLEQARTMQRNFIARHLKRREDKDAALVAYHTDGRDDWRFSLVRMEYKLSFDEQSGKVRVKDDVTPARRYSFLVGANEPNHTAQQQLFPILQDDVHNPTLAQLEEAFNIESVTREFFNQYKELFLLLKEEMDGIAAADPAVRAEFQRRQIDTATFAKKLLGQIIFLYFLQKKGWLGVRRGNPWGSGPKNFLRQLYQGHWRPYTNFFRDLLEPLFYEALALPAPDNFYTPLNCHIPFLNGGLFDPLNGYNWRDTHLRLKNETFGRILDTFDLYNFTVREDEPLEKEVAVDPEMLGKVFENLLEVRDRKSQGAFYTPREIVHYMCQESLIQYLETALNWRELPFRPTEPIQQTLFGDPRPRQQPLTERSYEPRLPRADIEQLIRRGEQVLQDEQAATAGTTGWQAKLPPTIRQNARLLDQALSDICVCDPAIGSGAFAVGMMQEIVRAREVLSTYLPGSADRSTYNLKWQAIERSIYGVDIDPAAVDIAKLRLWLSLVVDETDYQHIRPLPNLDYKILCGDSLQAIGGEDPLLHSSLLKQLRELPPQYFPLTDPQQKAQLKQRIDHLITQITGDQTRFDFRVYFHPVFEKRQGFDVVIGNPPYVRQEKLREYKTQFQRNFPEVYSGTADLYVYFYARALDLLHADGTLAYITSNKFMRAAYGRKLRAYLADQTTLRTIIDFGDLPIFEATAYPTIVITTKRKPPDETRLRALTVNTLDVLQSLPQAIEQSAWEMPQRDLHAEGWALVQPDVLALMAKLRRHRTPLSEYVNGKFYYGIKTGYNEAFVIDEKTRQQLIAADPRSAEVIKPWLRGRDIKRWKVNWDGHYLIAIQNSGDADANNPWANAQTEAEARRIFRQTYPAIHDYLSQYEQPLRIRQDQGRYWWELRACAYTSEFGKAKIIYPDIAKRPEFAYDQDGVFWGGNTLYILPTDKLYLLAILNSPVVEFFYSNISSTIRGGYFRFIATYVSQIPVPEVNQEQKTTIEELLEKLIESKDTRTNLNKWEQELNQIVYRLFQLTPAETALMSQVISADEDKVELNEAKSALSKLLKIGRGQ